MGLRDITTRAAAAYGLDSPDSVPVSVKTDMAMAEALGITRQSFAGLKRRHGKGFPVKKATGWKVHEVLDYISANCDDSERRHNTGVNPGDPEGKADYYEERARKMKLDADRQAIEVKRLNGELVSSSEVEREWSGQVAKLRATVEKGFHGLSPKLSGLDAPAILVELKKWWTKVQRTMAD